MSNEFKSCPACGAQCAGDMKFCAVCGTDLTAVPVASEDGMAGAVAAAVSSASQPAPVQAFEPAPAAAPAPVQVFEAAPAVAPAPEYAPSAQYIPAATPAPAPGKSWKAGGIILLIVALLLTGTLVFFVIQWSNANGEVEKANTQLQAFQGQLTQLQDQVTDLNSQIAAKDSDLAARDSQIADLNKKITDLESQSSDDAEHVAYLEEAKEFMDDYIVFIASDIEEEHYHKYDCPVFIECTEFLAFNRDNAEDKGYTPCPDCCAD